MKGGWSFYICWNRKSFGKERGVGVGWGGVGVMVIESEFF